MTNNTEIDNLSAELSAVVTRVQALENELKRVIQVGMGCDAANAQHSTLLQRGQDEAFERIKNLEMTIFPNLVRDVQEVHDIIGEGDDKADHPLDHRGQ